MESDNGECAAVGNLRQLVSPTHVSAPTAYLERMELFDNKADLHALKDLMSALSADLCSKCFTVIVGGLNLAEAALVLLRSCPKARLHAFEIQKFAYGIGVKKLRPYPNAQVHNLGMGHTVARYNVSRPGSAHEGAGLYNVGDLRGAVKITTATTVRLDSFVKERAVLQVPPNPTATPLRRPPLTGCLPSIQVHYALIDVEGFEARVMEGMGLSTEEGQRMFPTFQWEAADAWDDRRRPQGTMDRQQTLVALRSWGYDNYAIGITVPCGRKQKNRAGEYDPNCNASAMYLPIDESFPFAGRGSKRFLGNILSLHRQFASLRIRRFVRGHPALVAHESHE